MSWRFIRVLNFGFSFAIVLVVLSVVSLAQTGNVETRFETAVTADIESEQEVLSMLKRTNELRNLDDLSLALKNAKVALSKALATKNEQLVFVAQAHVDSIHCLQRKIGNEIRVMPIKLEDASPELRMLYYSAILETKIWFFERYSDFDTILHEYQKAASECDDHYLVLQQKALDAYCRVFFLNADPDSIEIQNQRENLKAMVSGENPFPAGEVIYELIASKSLEDRKDDQRNIETLENALSLAVACRNSYWIIRTNLCLVAIHAKNNKNGWNPTHTHFAAAIKESESFKSSAVTASIRVSFVGTARRFGPSQASLDQYERIQSSPANVWLSDQTRYVINRSKLWLFAQLQKDEEFQALKKQLEDSGALERAIEEQNSEIAENEYVKEINRDNRDKQSQLNRSEADKAELEQSQLELSESIRFFKGLSLTLFVFVLFLAPWFLSYVLRSRLRRVSTELDSQRETSRQSQERCDELSLRLNRLQRMESLGLMAGSVAHDFNNILVGVMGNAEVIQLKNAKDSESGTNDEFVKERIGSIIRSAEKAASLSRQMLAYAGKQHIARKPTDLNQLILGYDPILRSACRPNQRLKLELYAKPIVCRVDPTQIEQVILNLVTNAVEASADDGLITIRTGSQRISNVENDCSLYGTRTTGGDFNFIDVIDSGTGISEADLERIFEPFFSNSEIGRGLGLSVVYGAVVGHDGFIKCCSDVGQGTSFRILIPESIEPVLENANGRPQNENFLNRSDSPAPKKILVVDDEETVLELCEQLMNLNGWEVIKATGGEQGVQLAERHADEISCILADVVMPEMGANELLRELEDRQINIPVVLMSGFSQTRLEFFLDRPNVVSIIQKPFRASEITCAILNAIEVGMASHLVASTRLN